MTATDGVPDDLADQYRQTAVEAPALARRYWLEHPDADSADAEAWIHTQRVASAQARKAASGLDAKRQADADRWRQSFTCRACGENQVNGDDGLCGPCSRIAEQEAGRADTARRHCVRRYLAKRAATGETFRGHDISRLTNPTN